MPPVSARVYRIEAPYEGNAVHLYLVRGAKLALIDSGAADSPGMAVAPALAELGMSWSDLDYVLNTHGHVDHAGGNGEVKASAPRAQIGIHPADEELLKGPEAHLKSDTDASAYMRLMGRADLLHEREAVLRRVVGRSAGVDRELADGDVVDLGDDVRLTVIHTPGHTRGSVCFLWEGGSMVFSGDAVQGHGWKAGTPPIYHDTVYLESLTRIEELGAATLCMGHTFGWNGVSNAPVRTGPDIAATLQASREASAAIERATVHALQELGPDAPFIDLAQAAFREMAYDLPLLFDRRSVVPVVAARAIHAHLRAHRWTPEASGAVAAGSDARRLL
jgi:glyoxylase-like metal-dependent hydrolase (beta-lactamase superfamily II)